MASSTGSLRPTFEGHVATCRDALILFEACLQGQLSHVPRRPHDRERSSLIKSGSVFIYEENASGIRRWTDGVPWSPSRILGNFLVYRELEKPFPPGEKKRATKRSARRPVRPGEPYSRPSIDGNNPTTNDWSPTTPTTPGYGQPVSQPSQDSTLDKEVERSLIGSLVDSYQFKEGGLVKKTMSVTVNGVHHHLVSYYKMEDVLNKKLAPPSEHAQLRHIRPRPELTQAQNFRAPLDEAGDLAELDPRTAAMYGTGYVYNPQHHNYGPHPGPDSYYSSVQTPSYPAPAPPPPPSSSYPLPNTSMQHYYGSSLPNSSAPQRGGEGYGTYSSTPASYTSRYDSNPTPMSSALVSPTPAMSLGDRPPPTQPVSQSMTSPYPHSVNPMRPYEPSRWPQSMATSTHSNPLPSSQYSAPHLQTGQLQPAGMASWGSTHHS